MEGKYGMEWTKEIVVLGIFIMYGQWVRNKLLIVL